MSYSENTVDFNDYGLNVEDISKVSDETIKELGKKIIHAFKTFGYCYVKNHGMDDCLINDYFVVSRTFFEEPVEVKEKYPIGQDYAFGWVKFKGEKSDPKSEVRDLHEAFNYRPYSGYEGWPPTEKFEMLTKQFFLVGTELAYRFCAVLSLGLGLPKDFMRNAHKLIGKAGSSSAVRTLYYPPVKENVNFKPTQYRIGEHTDFGTVTFTFQDDVGGLEIRGPDGKFVQADPVSDTMLVYPGAMLQRWTAGNIVGASHRIPMPTDKHRRESVRQSFCWFLHPDDDFLVKCLDGSNIYEPMTSRNYINYKIKEAMPYLDPTVKLPAGK